MKLLSNNADSLPDNFHMNRAERALPAALTVAGSDSGAGAGIQADMFTFAANGVYACCAVAALTAQNPDEVAMVEEVSADFLRAQLNCVQSYYAPRAAKTGMLFSRAIIELAAEFFAAHSEIRLVVDPVMISSSGAKLLSDGASSALESALIPLAELLTPNLDEAAFLLGGVEISRRNIADCAQRLRDKYGICVLLKGGHLHGGKLADVLAERDGGVSVFEGERIGGVNTHGSGCTLSAALAANFAKGMSVRDACIGARAYFQSCLKNRIALKGDCFINHFPYSTK